MLNRKNNMQTDRVSWAILLSLALGLAGCSRSYVVLLAEDDGSLGKVEVNTPQGSTLLENNRDAVNLKGEAGKTFAVSEQQIKEDFGAAMAASPEKAKPFYLYFEGGTATLTAESMADIPNIIAEIKRRPAADISIIGHTDTVGDEQTNAALSLERARSVAALFAEAMPDTRRVAVDSHGEKNLLIATPDNTDEPKNRRVEVTVR